MRNTSLISRRIKLKAILICPQCIFLWILKSKHCSQPTVAVMWFGGVDRWTLWGRMSPAFGRWSGHWPLQKAYCFKTNFFSLLLQVKRPKNVSFFLVLALKIRNKLFLASFTPATINSWNAAFSCRSNTASWIFKEETHFVQKIC